MTLDRETLELLLLDQDAGALGAETDKLLVAYLRQEPHAASEAQEIRATLALARKTLTAAALPVLPKPKFDGHPEPSGTPLPGRAWAPWLAAAACLAIGFALGQTGAARRVNLPQAAAAFSPLPSPPDRHVSQEKPAAADKADVPAPARSFWSVRNLQLGTYEPPHRTAYTLVWDSPLKRPKIKTTL
jgi:hypothetical protein